MSFMICCLVSVVCDGVFAIAMGCVAMVTVVVVVATGCVVVVPIVVVVFMYTHCVLMLLLWVLRA